MSSLLFLPVVLVGASLLLFATSVLERLIRLPSEPVVHLVAVEGNGFNVGTAGMALMVVGAIGAVLSIAFWASWGGFARPGQRSAAVGTTQTVVREREAP